MMTLEKRIMAWEFEQAQRIKTVAWGLWGLSLYMLYFPLKLSLLIGWILFCDPTFRRQLEPGKYEEENKPKSNSLYVA